MVYDSPGGACTRAKHGMPTAYFRFYAELNDFLPPQKRQTTFGHAYSGRVAIKDAIEALGVPHPEVDLILVNGASVDFSYRLREGDRVSVYPVFESLDIAPLVRLRPEPLRDPKFVLDAHLGRLAAHLRLLGFDTLCPRDAADGELARLAAAERRILLTRDRGLLKRRAVSHGYCVRAEHPKPQVREVLARFDLHRLASPFTRCLRCNGELVAVEKSAIAGQVPPRAWEAFDEFRRCAACGRVYWQGSHYDALRAFVVEVLGGVADCCGEPG